jgi:DNA-binding IscR family transcriptional regulator
MDVVVLFERTSYATCPFGPDWCGHGEPCPLHHSIFAMKQIFDDYLRNTTFAVFKLSHRKERESNPSKIDLDKLAPKARPKRKKSQ